MLVLLSNGSTWANEPFGHPVSLSARLTKVVDAFPYTMNDWMMKHYHLNLMIIYKDKNNDIQSIVKIHYFNQLPRQKDNYMEIKSRFLIK